MRQLNQATVYCTKFQARARPCRDQICGAGTAATHSAAMAISHSRKPNLRISGNCQIVGLPTLGLWARALGFLYPDRRRIARRPRHPLQG